MLSDVLLCLVNRSYDVVGNIPDSCPDRMKYVPAVGTVDSQRSYSVWDRCSFAMQVTNLRRHPCRLMVTLSLLDDEISMFYQKNAEADRCFDADNVLFEKY